MTQVEELAEFVAGARFEDLSPQAIERFKLHVLDSLGVAYGALGSDPIRRIFEMTNELGGASLATLLGGGMTAPDRAAFFNSAAVRYLDFNDSYLAPNETFHPSDNMPAVLAASEWADASGKEFLAALAVAYEVQARLSEAAPVRAKGFDHTTQGAYAAAAGVTKALRLDPKRAANAIAMSGTANNALRVTRTGALSHWKGLAAPHAAMSATHCAWLAMHGLTGPKEVFEGAKGFQQSIAGPFHVDWKVRSLEGILRASLKKYNAEIHSQSTIEAALDLLQKEKFSPQAITRIEVRTFDVAYHIIGGGEEGEKVAVRTKEEADHSLPYLIAVALLDGEVSPDQYRRERIERADVQGLLRRVRVTPDPELSSRFPQEMPSKVAIVLKDGSKFETEKVDYEGFFTRPMSWSTAAGKFRRLTQSVLDVGRQDELIEAVQRIEGFPIRHLTRRIGGTKTGRLERSA